ncbi:restriction endonuclease subunit M [Thermococcus celer Vu 13 = JCM 8558]|uniref:site-specific DNA-methyltransferase (adenine-specific) n=2 Tax=Thermococcus celer TaxID=2264 RepID=A0A218P3C5_THECE|nr:class I SAM-dependent DNA methyltransferase [Thermococcus celer]ASI99426.1 restriction endonuclease subunit M [Thermococcus celer Vu 13 = JCM 8558]
MARSKSKPKNGADEWAILEKLQPWVVRRYFLIKEHFRDREFTPEDVEKLFEMKRKELQEKTGKDEPEFTTKNVGEVLSILRKAGLLRARKDVYDFRKTYYSLTFPGETKVTRDRLISLLKAAADQIRGGLDYKALLVFLFYKAISDRWMKRAQNLIKEGKPQIQAYLLTNKGYYRLFDEESGRLYTWHEVVKSRESIKELANALIKISEMNEELSDLKKLVEVLGLIGFIKEDNLHKLEEIVRIFNRVDFAEFDSDILGDAYEWILSYFAPQKAKEGEVYTPREVIRLLVELLDIEDESDVLDPASGSGGMLIEAYRYVREKVKKEDPGAEPAIMLYGQEINETTAALSKLNLILHGIQEFEIFEGADSLVNPRWEEELRRNGVEDGKADYVIANPPWNQDGYDEARLSDRRIKHIYRYGYTSKQSADWAWVQLMLHYARRKVGVVLDSGALFRGGAEKAIRQGIVEDDLIEAVVLLPEKLFYNTGAPGIIMVLNPNKPGERRGKVIFINASREFRRHPDVRRLNQLAPEHIEKIVTAFRGFREVDGFSRVVGLDEIRKNDYNLNVSLYVFPEEEGEHIDLRKEFEEFRKVEERERELVGKAKVYIEGIIRVMGDE